MTGNNRGTCAEKDTTGRRTFRGGRAVGTTGKETQVKRSTLLVAVLAGLLVVGMVAAGCGSSSTTPTTPIVGPVTGESI